MSTPSFMTSCKHWILTELISIFLKPELTRNHFKNDNSTRRTLFILFGGVQRITHPFKIQETPLFDLKMSVWGNVCTKSWLKNLFLLTNRNSRGMLLYYVFDTVPLVPATKISYKKISRFYYFVSELIYHCYTARDIHKSNRKPCKKS